MDRTAEIHELLQLTPGEVVERAGSRLLVCDDLDVLHRRFAEDMADDIRACRSRGLPPRFIVPVGPTGQYPFLCEILSREGLSLSDAWLYFMDEYCDAGSAVPCEHPLSFKAVARDLLVARLPVDLAPVPSQVIFPDESNTGRLAGLIERNGGVDVCYGGIGIHGHVAFNEPEPGVRDSDPRCVRLNDFTVTINAVRSHVGGNLEAFRPYAFTLGMRQILGSRKIRLYCRNGCDFDWANTVLRLALFGEPGDDYPVTHIRGRDYTITTDRATLASPANVL